MRPARTSAEEGGGPLIHVNASPAPRRPWVYLPSAQCAGTNKPPAWGDLGREGSADAATWPAARTTPLRAIGMNGRKRTGALSRRKKLQPRRFDRLHTGCRATAQRHQTPGRRPRRHPRQHLLGDEHDRQQQSGVQRTLRGRDWAGACPHDRRQRLGSPRRAQLSGNASFNGRYGKIYNRNLPKWYHGEAGRFSAFIPAMKNVHAELLTWNPE